MRKVLDASSEEGEKILDWDAQIARQEKLSADKLSEDVKELSAWPEVSEEVKIYDMPYSAEAVMDFYDTYKSFGMKFYSALQEEDGRASTKAVLLYEGSKPTVHYQMEDGTKLSVSEGDPGFRAMMEMLHKFYPGTSLLG